MKIIYCLFAAFFVVTHAFAMADSTPPVYGVPTLYGEYEISADDTRRASDMYGKYNKHPAAIRAGAIKNTAAAKHPVKAKKTLAKKKTIKKSKKAAIQKSEKVAKKSTQKIIAVAPKPTEDVEKVSVVKTDDKKAPVTVSTPVVSQDAVDIAARAGFKYDTESFCTQIKHQGQGNLPDGIIMMPGRPDLMSCVSNNKD